MTNTENSNNPALDEARLHAAGELAYDDLSPMGQLYVDLAELGLDDGKFDAADHELVEL